MKIISHIHQLLLGILFISSGILISCDTFNEELPECRLFVKFKYDYNMDFADAFHSQVNEVELYVFDKEGKYLFKQSEYGAILTDEGYMMEIEVPVGEYQFMAWAKSWVYDENNTRVDAPAYELPTLTRIKSTISDMNLKLERDYTRTITQELEGLWYGEILRVNFTGEHFQTETINLIKDTHKVRFGFQSYNEQNGGVTIDVNEYTYEIIESNGHLNYDNSLLADDVLSYQPYYKEQRNSQAAVVELNTMRLMANRESRLVVTHIATGTPVFSINLTDYLLMAAVETYSKMSAQEYLDRKHEHAIVFFLGGGSTRDSWLAVQIEINGWTWYIQHENN